jgi:hypothetical protein
MRISNLPRRSSAFTLAEIVIASALGMITIGATIYGYVMTSKRAEWTGYSLAANSLAVQRLEQARACKWDPFAFPAIDELVSTNFPVQINIMDLPVSGTNIVYATNFTSISTVQASPPLKMIRVDCCWNFLGKRNFTNTVVTYRAPDQ